MAKGIFYCNKHKCTLADETFTLPICSDQHPHMTQTAETFCWHWKKEISGDHITLIRGGTSLRIHVASIILPRHDAHKISNKRWNTALEDCGVATYHILIVHLSLVKLQYNCNTDTCYIGGVRALFTNYHSQTLKDRNCPPGRCATKQH